MKLVRLATGVLLGLASSVTLAGFSNGMMNTSPKMYASIFGGIASSNQFDINQYGTVFFTEAEGGPLAVNVFDNTDSHTAGLLGANVGLQWNNMLTSKWSISPAIELEGYYLGKSSFTANGENFSHERVSELSFKSTYPTQVTVLLTNAILNFTSHYLGKFHPYVGIGFGSAIASISDADAFSTSPPETINHYNSNSSDSAVTFAGQTKLGLSYQFTDYLGLFIEYRWLYLASTSFEFGSTIDPAHAPTTNWTVKMDPHYYNIGTLGLQFSF